MGELEFIFDKNPAISIGHFDFCDKCMEYKSIEGGSSLMSNGLDLLWFCSECK